MSPPAAASRAGLLLDPERVAPGGGAAQCSGRHGLGAGFDKSQRRIVLDQLPLERGRQILKHSQQGAAVVSAQALDHAAILLDDPPT